MNISKDLFLAILSLDAYNQGYGRGLDHGKTQIGSATKITDSTFVFTDPNADTDDDTLDEAASFYAVAYDVTNGSVTGLANNTVVISYRGTDQPSILGNSDIWTGWITASGSLSPQAKLAAEFYHSVKTANPTKNIVLTGHSLGGGLAGLVASLFGEEAVIFDNMPFEAASDNAYEIATRTDAQIDALAAARATAAETSAVGGPYDVVYAFEKNALEVARANVLDVFYNNEVPQAIDRTKISGRFVPGEFLQAARVLQQTAVDALDSHIGYFGAGLFTSYELHSLSLLDILQFAEDEEYTDWTAISKLLWNTTFNDDVAKLAGFQGKDDGGTYKRPAELTASIAYSALDGTTGLVFGNTGIRAMFDDANQLGQLVTRGTAIDRFETLGSTGLDHNLRDKLTQTIVQFAGQMALQEVDYTGNALTPEQGILHLSAGGAAGETAALIHRCAA